MRLKKMIRNDDKRHTGGMYDARKRKQVKCFSLWDTFNSKSIGFYKCV